MIDKMVNMINKVVQFTENHKWCGCLGIISDANIDTDSYLIGIPIPDQGTAYIFAQLEDFEIIGDAVLV